MILCLGPTPAAQRVMVFRRLQVNAVNRAATTLDGAAGKAINVAKVLKALGQRPLVVGFLGGDRGHELLGLLRNKAIATDFAKVAPPTRQCITVIDQATGAQTELVEESRPVTQAAYKQLLSIVRRRLPTCRAIVMSGTIPPVGPPDLYRKCVQWANQAGALTIVDATGSALLNAIEAKPALVKPNRSELAATLQAAGLSPSPMPAPILSGQEERAGKRMPFSRTSRPIHGTPQRLLHTHRDREPSSQTDFRQPRNPEGVQESSPGLARATGAYLGLTVPNNNPPPREERAGRGKGEGPLPVHAEPSEPAVLTGMRHLFERGAQRVVVTAGAAPILAFDGRKTWRILPPRIQVLNSIGCGDAFTAGLVCRLLRGDDLGEACRWAAATAAADALTLMPGEIDVNAAKRLLRRVRVEAVR